MGKTISILSVERPYDITVGTSVLMMLPRFVRSTRSPVALISDANVLKLHGAKVRNVLKDIVSVSVYSFEPGEKSKSRTTKAAIEDAMLADGLDRNTLVIGMGGGVTTDLAGFVAGTYLRGVPWIAIPTSLLGAVDASVGGKVGVNTGAGKNLVGLFNQPQFVGVDLDLIATLPPCEVDNGMAEMVKHGIIADRGYFERLVARGETIRNLEHSALLDAITRSVEIKAEVVSRDPRESDYRQILNAGHTIAHALENVSGFEINHGRAVAIGLSVEACIAERLGLMSDGDKEHLRGGLRALGLPVAPPADMDSRAVLRATLSDKKGREGRPRYALPMGLGKMSVCDSGYSRPVEDEIVLEAIEEAKGCSV